MTQTSSKPWIVKTLAQVAEFFGVAPTTVRKEWRSAGLPGRQGSWNLAEILHWRDSRRSAERKAAKEAAAAGGQALDQRLLAEQIRKLALANNLKEGQLVQRTEVVQEASELVIAVRSRLEAIPTEIEMSLPPEVRYEVKADIDHRIRQALKELASGTVGGTTGEDAILAAADAIRERRDET